MVNRGGAILEKPEIVTVTFRHIVMGDAGVDGGDAGYELDAGPDGSPPGTPDPFLGTLRAFDNLILTTNWWTQAMAGYCNNSGTCIGQGKQAGAVELPDIGIYKAALVDESTGGGGASLTDDIVAWVKSGVLPAPNAETLYAIYLPLGTSISLQGTASCVEFLGYHSSVMVTLPDGVTQVEAAYAVMPRCDFGGTKTDLLNMLTTTASHEFAEAATDAHPTTDGAYYMIEDDNWVPSIGISYAGGEVGDVCINAASYDESGYQVQPIWSNGAAKASQDPCEPTTPSTEVYYGAAVRAPKQKVTGCSRCGESNGYIALNHGTSVDVLIDVFSQKALPHDVRLFVGAGTNQQNNPTQDPTNMSPIPHGVTASLSRDTAHNGNGVIMTVTAPNTAAKGDARFVVRSVLSQTDYHDWPIIVHVN
jgi:hypothetical protein